jgi:hypothetical protein
VRDLIYSGRLPSQRIGRLHYVKRSDLETERRRRLGLAPAGAHPRKPQRALRELHLERRQADPALRRQRAAGRAALVKQWAERHAPATESRLPFVVLSVSGPTQCQVCGREVRRGRILEAEGVDGQLAPRMCLACGRRALLKWADRRRQEAAAARRLAESLGERTAPTASTENETHPARVA